MKRSKSNILNDCALAIRLCRSRALLWLALAGGSMLLALLAEQIAEYLIHLNQ